MELAPLDLSRTALVLIDLQQGIVAMPTAPRSGPDVLKNAVRLADTFRRAGALVVLVHVGFSGDGRDMLKPEVDSPMQGGARPANWMELVPEIGPRPGDLVIFKHQWGAFYGTELDLQLRRRGITTIVLGGIATNIGVESTARDAYERGYAQIFVEDAMASRTEEGHTFTVRHIFPLIGRVRSTDEVLAACATP
jgi:nicotinamidase-related amidase